MSIFKNSNNTPSVLLSMKIKPFVTKCHPFLLAGTLTFSSFAAFASTPELDNFSIPYSILAWFEAKKNDTDEFRKDYFKVIDDYFMKFANDHEANYTGAFTPRDSYKDSAPHEGDAFFYDKFLVRNVLPRLACDNYAHYLRTTMLEKYSGDEDTRQKMLELTAEMDKIINDSLIEKTLAEAIGDILREANNTESFVTDELIELIEQKLEDTFNNSGVEISVDAIKKNLSKALREYLMNGDLKSALKELTKGRFKALLETSIYGAVQSTKLLVLLPNMIELYRNTKAQEVYFKEMELLSQYVREDCMDVNALYKGNAEYGMVSTFKHQAIPEKYYDDIYMYGIFGKREFDKNMFGVAKGVKHEHSYKLEFKPNLSCTKNCSSLNRMYDVSIPGGHLSSLRQQVDELPDDYILYKIMPSPQTDLVEGSNFSTLKNQYIYLYVPGHLRNISQQEYYIYEEIYNSLGHLLNLGSSAFRQEITIAEAADYAKQIFKEDTKKVDYINQWESYWKENELYNEEDYLNIEIVSSLIGVLQNNKKPKYAESDKYLIKKIENHENLFLASSVVDGEPLKKTDGTLVWSARQNNNEWVLMELINEKHDGSVILGMDFLHNKKNKKSMPFINDYVSSQDVIKGRHDIGDRIKKWTLKPNSDNKIILDGSKTINRIKLLYILHIVSM
ncbi:hypothetical protein [Thiomicrospira microaerophila]|uniref:hypothetical protein n=1 Tax=Thiomicrospira microaerophila TaxID=406020 RepID=UPI0005C8CFF9|nr:hypothetical protein [Thiomicrospira microaerophila]